MSDQQNVPPVGYQFFQETDNQHFQHPDENNLFTANQHFQHPDQNNLFTSNQHFQSTGNDNFQPPDNGNQHFQHTANLSTSNQDFTGNQNPFSTINPNVAVPNIPTNPGFWTNSGQPYVDIFNAPFQINPNEPGTWTMIQLRRSDGQNTTPPADKIKAGEHVLYVPVVPGSKVDFEFRKKIGEKLGDVLGIQRLVGTQGIVLTAWPSGYSHYRRVKSENSREDTDLTKIQTGTSRNGTSRVDNHVFGHPKGGSYDHANKAIKHFSWLGQGHQPCTCGKCKIPTNPYST